MTTPAWITKLTPAKRKAILIQAHALVREYQQEFGVTPDTETAARVLWALAHKEK